MREFPPRRVPPLVENAREVTATELTRDTAAILDEVGLDGARAVITRRGRPVALLVGLPELMDALVRDQEGAPPTEHEAFAELVGHEIARRWQGRSQYAREHGRERERIRAPHLSGDEIRRRTMRRIRGA